MTVLYSFPLRIGTCGIGMTAYYQVAGLVDHAVRVNLYGGSCEKDIFGLNSVKQTLVHLGIKLSVTLLGMYRAAVLHDRIVAQALRIVHKKIDIVHCWRYKFKERQAAKLSTQLRPPGFFTICKDNRW